MNWGPLLLRLVPGCVMLAAIGVVSVISWHKPPSEQVTVRRVTTVDVAPQQAPVWTVPGTVIKGGEPAGTLPAAEPPVTVWPDRDGEPDHGPAHLDGDPQPVLSMQPGSDLVPDTHAALEELRPQHPRPRTRATPRRVAKPPPPPPPSRDAAVSAGPRWPTMMVRVKPEPESWQQRAWRVGH